MLKKLICCVIMCLILIGCSSPQERLNKAQSVCNECSLLFRSMPGYVDADEVFLLQDKNKIYYINIDFRSRIYDVKQITLK